MENLIVVAAMSFLAGALIIYLLFTSVAAIRRRNDGRRGTVEDGRRAKRQSWKPKTSTVVLVIVALFVLLFTYRMIELYEATGGIPDTLVVSVFAFCGGECGALSWIRTSKERYRERQWELEDRRRMERDARRPAQPMDDLEPSFTADQEKNRP